MATRTIEFMTYLTGLYADDSPHEPEYHGEADIVLEKDLSFGKGWQIKDIKIIALWADTGLEEAHKARQYVSINKIELKDQYAVYRAAEEAAEKYIEKTDLDQEEAAGRFEYCREE